MSSHGGLGDARREALRVLQGLLTTRNGIERAVLGQDLFGFLRPILWIESPGLEHEVRERASAAFERCAPFWSGEIWICATDTPYADRVVFDSAWEEGHVTPDEARIRLDDRVRTRSGWLPHVQNPPWDIATGSRGPRDSADAGPPIVVFYSFKGGVGRTTALAAFALARARAGERVFVLDFDLDAPGAGTLISPDEHPPSKGVVDFLIESPIVGSLDMADYVHRVRRAALVGDRGGEITVLPAGTVDADYLAKLSRLDLEVRRSAHPLSGLLEHIRGLRPDWILVDSRAGLSTSAGIVLNGIAHGHVLFGTSSHQSQIGLTEVIRHLGEERIIRNLSQAHCLFVHAMVVDVFEVEKAQRAQFDQWLEGVLQRHYFVAAEDDPEDRYWSVRDADNSESPSKAVAVSYRTRFAFFDSLDDVADELCSGPYAAIESRIMSLLGRRSRAEADDEE